MRVIFTLLLHFNNATQGRSQSASSASAQSAEPVNTMRSMRRSGSAAPHNSWSPIV